MKLFWSFLHHCWDSSCPLFLRTLIVVQYTTGKICPPLFSACFRCTHVARQRFTAFRLHGSSSSTAETVPVSPLPAPGSHHPISVFMNLTLVLLFSRSVTSSSLQPHGLQHARLPCLSLSPEFVQTLVHWVGDAIQPSHPLSSPSPPAFNLSQHQGLFKRDSSSHQVAKALEFQLQHQSFQWTLRTDFL